MKKSYFMFGLLALISSCSLVKKTAMSVTADIINEGSNEVFTEGNLDYFEKSAPGNLKLLEGLWFGDQENETLLSMLIKGHAGYTFAVLETNAFEELILDEPGPKKELTILGYEKAIFYGLKYLELKGITEKQFFQKDFSLQVPNLFESKMSKDDYVALFYFAQALGSSINIQRQNVNKMGLLSHVNSMLHWVCKKDPSLENGNCQFFQAVIEASTPTLLGGSQVKAKKMFEDIISQQSENLLLKFGYIQYHIVPLIEEDEYYLKMESLTQEINDWFNLQLGNRTDQNLRFADKRSFNLYNAITKRKMMTLKKIEKEFF